jgi:hypothetical protein
MRRINVSLLRYALAISTLVMPLYAHAQSAPNPGAPASKQAGGKPDLVEMINQCFAEAMAKSAAKQDGNTIEFACYGDKASALFGKLARFDKEELVTFKTGKYITRNFYDGTDKMMPDYCWQKVASADGTPTSGFGCQLYYVAGRILGN